jgi:lipid II:glycine glycyltransferase (peptidoglycan interpeptide bridge formation enzyme)
MVLSLSQPLEDIRKQLDQKWRNCLNSSEKKSLAVSAGTEDVLFKDFLSMYTELKQRKEFHVDLDPGFYRNVQDGLLGSDRFWLTLIYLDGQPLAGHVASVLGDTCIYLLGATSASGLKNNAAYLAQWSVVKMAKEKGCLWYDLGGIDPEGNKGVYHFKKGMGGMDISAANPSELTPGMVRRSIVFAGEKVFGAMKKVTKR